MEMSQNSRLNDKLTRIILKEAMKRDDRSSIPLIVELCEMSKYYPIPYLIKHMKRNYNGGQTYQERYGERIQEIKDIQRR